MRESSYTSTPNYCFLDEELRTRARALHRMCAPVSLALVDRVRLVILGRVHCVLESVDSLMLHPFFHESLAYSLFAMFVAPVAGGLDGEVRPERRCQPHVGKFSDVAGRKRRISRPCAIFL